MIDMYLRVITPLGIVEYESQDKKVLEPCQAKILKIPTGEKILGIFSRKKILLVHVTRDGHLEVHEL